jgi:antitoxin StbD
MKSGTAVIEGEIFLNNTPSITELFENMISITDLNKGKGAKIIDEMKRTGYKVILKNNRPEAVLITPNQFEEMLALKEELADMTLGMEALRRMVNFNPEAAVSHEDMLAEFGITHAELDNIDVEIG